MSERLRQEISSRTLNKQIKLQDSRWYNKDGEMIGNGDLSPQDISRMSQELEFDEVLFIVPAHLALPKNPCADFDEKNPGIDHIANNAVFLLKRGVCYLIDKYNLYRSLETNVWGIKMNVLPRQLVGQYIPQHRRATEAKQTLQPALL